MATVPADEAHAGDVVHEHDWDLHVTGVGVDDRGAYIDTVEFPDDHLHLGAQLRLDRPDPAGTS